MQVIEMHDTDTHDSEPHGVAHGWFESCVEHRGATHDDPCDDCGWLAAEHTAGLAVVIEVIPVTTARPPLRRAS